MKFSFIHFSPESIKLLNHFLCYCAGRGYACWSQLLSTWTQCRTYIFV